MIYLRARYYDTALGRFITADTHWNVDNMIYGDNSEIVLKDEDDFDETQDELTKKTDIHIIPINKYSILQSSNLYTYAINNPIYFVDISGKEVVICGIAVSTAVIVATVGMVSLVSFLTVKKFSVAFCEAINSGMSIENSIFYAKGKTKQPKPPNKLMNGDKVKTPNTHPDEFQKQKDGSYKHKKSKWIFKKDQSGHRGEHWDASPKGKTGNYINVAPDGRVL